MNRWILLGVFWVGGVNAEVSTPTGKIEGYAPQAAPSLNLATPAPGDTLTVDIGFTDVDGDAESGSVVEWYREGTLIDGAAGTSLLLEMPGIGGDTVSARVTPQTDPVTTDPSTGTAVDTSAVRVAEGAILSRFVGMSVSMRTWADSNTYCESLGGGARIPTTAELQQVFADSTKYPGQSGPNSQMCGLHGWPLRDMCAGDTHVYWAAEDAGGGQRAAVDLYYSGVYVPHPAGTVLHVACIR